MIRLRLFYSLPEVSNTKSEEDLNKILHMYEGSYHRLYTTLEAKYQVAVPEAPRPELQDQPTILSDFSASDIIML